MLLHRRTIVFSTVMLASGCGGNPRIDAPAPVLDGVPVKSSYLTLSTMKSQPANCDLDGTCFSTAEGLVTPNGRVEAIERYYPASKQASLSRLTDWMDRFGFPRRRDDETLDAYRARANVSVYFNINELGLGRELGCVQFDDSDTSGRPAKGLACYVGNYGTSFGDPASSLPEAELGAHYRGTVAISYQPSLPPRYQVQFAAFDAQRDGRGHLADAAQLDTMGQRPVPQICTNCHGGVYDSATHLAKDAHFLPLNPFVVGYDTVAPFRREDQLEAARFINALAFQTDLEAPERDVLLTSDQKDYVRALYAIGDTATSIPVGALPAEDRPPPSWDTSDDARALWQHAILPYCATCHAALPPAGMNYVASHDAFAASWPAMKSAVCGAYSMPHAQPTLERFWSTEIVVAWKIYASPKAFLATMMGGGEDDCKYQRGSGCGVGRDQAASNARCGDPATSGRYCNFAAAGGEGRCEAGCGAPAGGVGCGDIGPNRQTCAGEHRCEPCGRTGQASCSGTCNEGKPSADGSACVGP
jgi:hypothetical protein